MFPQMPGFEHALPLLKNLWGQGTQGLVPGFPGLSNLAVPTLDVEELDARIGDLKTVESWLALNMNVLRSTIQGLEVQRATLLAVKSFGAALSPDVVQAAMQAATTSMAETAAKVVGRVQPEAEPEAPAADGADAGAAEAAAAEALGAAAPARMWWELLQNQFGQIANSAAVASELGKAALSAAVPMQGAMADVMAAAVQPKAAAAPAEAPAEPPADGSSAKAARPRTARKPVAEADTAAKSAPARKSGTRKTPGSGL